MLVAAAVCPCPPLLVTGVGRPEAELDNLRSRCRAAVSALGAAPADRLFVVGADIGPRATSFAPWAPGADATDEVRVPEPVPLSLLVGAALLGSTERSYVAVDPELSADECADLGRDLADSAPRVALLVMGDGSARHSERAPGYLDERAAGYDAAVSTALAAADPAALLALDRRLAVELLAGGTAAWQALAGAARGSRWRAAEPWFGAPYGVGYHVVTWAPAGGKAGIGRPVSNA